MTNNIVITGIGFISNIGNRVEDFWAGRVSKTQEFDIKDFDPKKFIKRKLLKPLDQITGYCIAGCNLALESAGWFEENFINDPQDAEFVDYRSLNEKEYKLLERSSVGIISGSMYHGIYSIFDIKKRFYEGGIENVSPLYFPGTVFNASASHVAIEHHFTGPNCTVNSGMSSGLYAIIKGVQYLNTGRTKLMICGGAEMHFDYISHMYHKMGLLSKTKMYSPFDISGDGMMLGEGSCFFALESKKNAISHNSKIYAEILSYHSNHCPDKKDIENCLYKCIIKTLRNETCDYTNMIDLIVLDGFGNPKVDGLISQVIDRIFKDSHAYIVSNKSTIGHTLGASGAFNLLEGILSLQNQEINPMQMRESPISDKLRITDMRIKHKVEYVLITSLGLDDGNYSCILIKK